MPQRSLDLQFIAFFFPQAHADIDWRRGYEFLDKELQKITADAAIGRRAVDKLVKVWLKSGTELIALLHCEVQGNRESETASTVTGAMAAEDISLLATADVFATYSQTDAEYGLGLGRMFIEKSRNSEGKMSVLMTQAYAIGQFCHDSIRLKAGYWDMMESKDTKTGRRKRRDDDED